MEQNTWIYIILGIIAVAIIGIVILKNANTKPSKITKSNVNLDKLFTAIGGKDNFVSCEANGSKVTFVLNDIKAISQETLKALGASGIVASKNKVTVIFGKSSETLVNEIKQTL